MTINRRYPLLVPVFLGALLLVSHINGQDDWRRWRGPEGNGIAAEGQTPPTIWDEDHNVVWKVKVPGRGHASPIIVEDKIFLATAEFENETQSVLCFDRKTGKQLWQTQVNQGEFNPRVHRKNTHASPTVATDGERIFAVFNNHNSVQLFALDFAGQEIWQKKVGEFRARFPFGFGSSPITHNGKVIATNLNQVGSAIVAYDGETGSEEWRIDRNPGTSYSTPVVAAVAGREQLLLSGVKSIVAYDPDSGQKLWTVPGKWDVTCGTMVWNDRLVFASGGFPAQQTLAVKADGSGELVWENSVKAYEQSMLEKDGYVYAHGDNNVVYCWRAADGQEMWKQRFSSRKAEVSASPVYSNGNIYFTAENGQTLVVKADSEKMVEVARNKLGDESFASLAFCGNQIFSRVAIFDLEDGSRQEWLFCLGE